LVWYPSVRQGASADAAMLARLDDLRNVPAVLELAGGRSAEADYERTLCYPTRDGMDPGFTCEFDVWHADGRCLRVRDVWRLHDLGGGFSNCNMTSALALATVDSLGSVTERCSLGNPYRADTPSKSWLARASACQPCRQRIRRSR
jgi:hypothetical protein